MDNDILEAWMHASDEERNEMQKQWNVNNKEGQEIIKKISDIFKEECVYSVAKVDISNRNDAWEIEAYVGHEDYKLVKDRYHIKFLGLDVNFHDITAS